jgi:DNA polymerase III alpha subunit
VGARIAPPPRAAAARAARAPALAAPDGRALAPDPVAPLPVPALPEFDAAERVLGEIAATGLWFSGHPLDASPAEAWRGVTPAAQVAARTGARVRVAGLPCAYRRVETRSGGLMLFLTLADRTGVVECVLFPDACRRYATIARGDALIAEGRVDETLGAVTVSVERLAPLPLTGGGAGTTAATELARRGTTDASATDAPAA